MKKIIVIFVCFAAISIFGPIAFIKPEAKEKTQNTKTVSANQSLTEIETDSFSVKLKSGEIVTVSRDDYILGCIAGEMPVNYNDEALKAQGIAAYTFALYKRETTDNEYDITADYRIDQCYLTDGELREKWGDKYEEKREKLKRIVNSIKGKWISYDNRPILSVYHGASCGVTFSCKDVWGKDLPYLQSVDSSFDKLSDEYINKEEFSFSDFYKKTDIGSKTDEKPKIILKTQKNGRVEEVTVNGKKISGSDFCNALSLKSQNFNFEVKDNSISFTAYGRGHGVGMSQVGANYLASNGSTYKEILHHYYKGCSIK